MEHQQVVSSVGHLVELLASKTAKQKGMNSAVQLVNYLVALKVYGLVERMGNWTDEKKGQNWAGMMDKSSEKRLVVRRESTKGLQMAHSMAERTVAHLGSSRADKMEKQKDCWTVEM